MKHLLFVACLVFAAGCPGKSKPEATDPCKDPCKEPCKDEPPEAMTCHQMADHIVGVMAEVPPEQADAYRTMFAEECAGWIWDQATIDCMGAAGNQEEGEACMGTMTPEQQASFDERFDEVEEQFEGE